MDYMNLPPELVDSPQFAENNDKVVDLASYLASLTIEKIKLAEAGRYIEAETIKRKINELKNQIEDTTKKTIGSQHEIEFKALQEEGDREIFEFQSAADAHIAEFEEKTRNEEMILNEAHNEELKALMNYIENILPKVLFLKHSKEYLDLRQIESSMAKQERYLEAHSVKVQTDLMARDEDEKFNKEKDHVIRSKLDKLARKQTLEKNALRDKYFIEFEIIKKGKDENLEKILNKYRIRRNELEVQQKSQKLLSENNNLRKAKTLSKFTREKQLNNSNSRSKASFHSSNDPEVRIKALRKLNLNYSSK